MPMPFDRITVIFNPQSIVPQAQAQLPVPVVPNVVQANPQTGQVSPNTTSQQSGTLPTATPFPPTAQDRKSVV